MEKTPHRIVSLIRPDETASRLKNLIYAALLLTGVFNNGCAVQQKAADTPAPKKYEFKQPEIRKVKRPINFCAASIKDIQTEKARCVSDILINKENGLHCLRCTTETEEVKYQ